MEYDKVTRHLRKLAFAFETILAGLALINNNPGWNYPWEHMAPVTGLLCLL